MTVKCLAGCSSEAASGCLLSGMSAAVSRKVKIVGGETTKQEFLQSDCHVTKKRKEILKTCSIRGLHSE